MKQSTYRMTLTALFVALVLLLGLTPFGIIPLGFINVTVLCVPVIVGTILLGLKCGLLLGAFFGIASALSAFGLSMTPPSALASALVAASPVQAVLVCLIPRLLVPATTYFAYRMIRGKAALPIAAIVGSLTNTVVYLGLMLAAYTVNGLDSTLLRSIIAGSGIVIGLSEAVVAAILVTPIVLALSKVKKSLGEKA